MAFGLRVLKSPPRSPKANALCERLIGTVRRECLDWLIPRIRQLPPYVQVMGAPEAPSITRIVREGSAWDRAGRDFDFSLASIQAHMNAGLEAGRRALIGERFNF